MKLNHKIISSFLLLAATLSSAGQDPLESIIADIIGNNPELLALKHEQESGRISDRVSNSLPDPEIEFQHLWGRDGTGNKWSIGVMQSFEWPGVYSSRKKANAYSSTAMDYLYESTRLDKAIEAKNLLLDAVYTRQQMDIINEISANMEEVAEKIHTGYKQGEMTILDEKKITFELFNLEERKAGLLSHADEISAGLKALNGGTDVDLTGIDTYPIENILPLDEYIGQICTLDPLYISKLNEIKSIYQNAHAASKARFPGITLGYHHDYEMGEIFNGFSVGISLPVYSGGKRKAAVLEKAYSAEASLEALRSSGIANIHTTFSKMQSLRGQIEKYSGLFGDGKYPGLLRKALDGGEINVITYLMEINYYLNATMDYLETDYRYRQAIASLNKYAMISDLP